MELKFRAWHKANERYYEVISLLLRHNNVEIRRDYTLIFEVIPLKDVIIEQYTGLKDKNGKDVYVGDVVKYHRNIGSIIDGYRFVVDHLDGNLFLNHKFNEVYDVSWDLVEIVSNVHENKELVQ